MLAYSASWLFRVIPYLVFAGTWVAASLVPTFRGGFAVLLVGRLDCIDRAAGQCAFILALAGLDVGTSFGGIGSSREVMIASLAEPAMLMIVFTVALIAGSTQLSAMAFHMTSGAVGCRAFSLGLALLALDHGVGICGKCAHSNRQPGDPSRAHNGSRGNGAGILRGDMGLIDLASELKLLFYVSVIASLHTLGLSRHLTAMPERSRSERLRMSPSLPPAPCSLRCSRRPSPRCAPCFASRHSLARR